MRLFCYDVQRRHGGSAIASTSLAMLTGWSDAVPAWSSSFMGGRICRVCRDHALRLCFGERKQE
jgi:hypothetical protein